MSDNRLWLRCRCGERKLLFKYYPDHGFVYHTQDALTDWLNEHCLLCGETVHDIGHITLENEDG